MRILDVELDGKHCGSVGHNAISNFQTFWQLNVWLPAPGGFETQVGLRPNFRGTRVMKNEGVRRMEAVGLEQHTSSCFASGLGRSTKVPCQYQSSNFGRMKEKGLR
jgi:hypothetical protein